jgi:hypothetical protein
LQSIEKEFHRGFLRKWRQGWNLTHLTVPCNDKHPLWHCKPVLCFQLKESRTQSNSPWQVRHIAGCRTLPVWIVGAGWGDVLTHRCKVVKLCLLNSFGTKKCQYRACISESWSHCQPLAHSPNADAPSGAPVPAYRHKFVLQAYKPERQPLSF